MKKGIKIFLIIIFVMYIGLYFSYRNGYYEIRNNEKKILTEEMIKEYEQDLLNGVDVTNKEYVVVRPDYTNVYTQNLLKVSKKIEKGFKRVVKYFFKHVSDAFN
jgi:hypothetical protein